MEKLIFAALSLISALLLAGCGDDGHPMHDDHDAHLHEDDAMANQAGEHASAAEDHYYSDDHHGSEGPATAPEGARQITITATDFEFDPAEIEAEPGETLFVTLVNQGKSPHMWQVRNMSGTHIHTPMGETSNKVITVPEQAGEYEIYCGTAGHEDLGMVGTLEVISQ